MNKQINENKLSYPSGCINDTYTKNQKDSIYNQKSL